MFSISEAVKEKYCKKSMVCHFEVLYVPKEDQRKKIPYILLLDDCNIDHAGDEKELAEICRGVRELDLANNKINSWDEINKILKQTYNLQFINLSFNKLILGEEPFINKNYGKLTKVVLNGTDIPWSHIEAVLKNIPCIEELHLSLNHIKNINCKVKHVNNKILYFTGNPLSKWTELHKLGHIFPSLQSLIISDCPIKYLGSAVYFQKAFSQLKSINLNGSLLESWEEVNKLNRIQHLTELKLDRCPLIQHHNKTEYRQLLIGWLPNIKYLNGSAVTNKEREDSERAFIRFYRLQLKPYPSHFWKLVEEHGLLDPLADIDFKPETKILLIIQNGEQFTKATFSVYLTVRQLKHELQQITGIKAKYMKLYYIDQFNKYPEEMRFYNKKLYTYKMQNGDSIIVDNK